MMLTELPCQFVKGRAFLVGCILVDYIRSFLVEEDRRVGLLLETHSNDTGPVLANKAHLVIVIENPFCIFLHLFLFDLMCLKGDSLKYKPA